MSLAFDLGREIIVDSFAGGGGASRGIELALGRGPDIAVPRRCSKRPVRRPLRMLVP